MESKTKLWGVVLPKPTTFIGLTFKETIRINSNEKPKVLELDYLRVDRVVRMVIEAKADGPQVVLIPLENVCGIIPMPGDGDSAVTAPPSTIPVVTAEQVAKFKAQEAERAQREAIAAQEKAIQERPTELEAAEMRKQYQINHGTGAAPTNVTTQTIDTERRRQLGLPPLPGTPQPESQTLADLAAKTAQEQLDNAAEIETVPGPCCEYCDDFISKDNDKNILMTGLCGRNGQEVSKTAPMPPGGCDFERTDWRHVERSEDFQKSSGGVPLQPKTTEDFERSAAKYAEPLKDVEYKGSPILGLKADTGEPLPEPIKPTPKKTAKKKAAKGKKKGK